ncbi:UNVERIFIED_CONTAM: hypothetical protein Scaly_0694200 [Sesamum calycinum]|uniref:Uncharacterized protein n=1 Tax=Sesamum calycinum TaxID=2727403 RepID=A0AAW2R759_9LAMI
MVELTNTMQWKDEAVINYINHWCALSLNYKDKLLETLAVEMCIRLVYSDDEDTKNTNVPSITPTNDMHVLKTEQKALPFPSKIPPKLRLNNCELVQIEGSIVDMEPFTKIESYVCDVKLYLNPGGMQEAMHLKFLTSQLIKEVHFFRKQCRRVHQLTIGEVSTNKNHKSKKPLYSLVFPYVARSNKNSKQSSSQDHAPLSKGVKQSSKVKIKDPHGANELIEPVIVLHPLVSNEPFLLKKLSRRNAGGIQLKSFTFWQNQGKTLPLHLDLAS